MRLGPDCPGGDVFFVYVCGACECVRACGLCVL